ncbi:MAG: hypothetical protein QOH71_2918 [Blastocatellia bacterium]|nr:hypothetical protein [Blastocatellia bacterium]
MRILDIVSAGHERHKQSRCGNSILDFFIDSTCFIPFSCQDRNATLAQRFDDRRNDWRILYREAVSNEGNEFVNFQNESYGRLCDIRARHGKIGMSDALNFYDGPY